MPMMLRPGVLIGTVYRLAKPSLSPSGPAPSPRQPPGSPPVVPLIGDKRYYGETPAGLAPGRQGERGHLGRREADPGVGSSQRFARIHLAARHFRGRGRRFLASGLRQIVAEAPNPYPGFSQAWLVVKDGVSGQSQSQSCTSASSYLPLSKADLRPRLPRRRLWD
jgi:hypothetical protein